MFGFRDLKVLLTVPLMIFGSKILYKCFLMGEF